MVPLALLLMAPAGFPDDSTPVVLYSAYPDCSRLEKKIQKLEARERDLRDAVVRLKQRLKASRQREAVQRRRLKEAQAELEGLRRDLAEAREKVSRLEMLTAALEEENRSLRSTNDFLTVTLVAREAELARLQDDRRREEKRLQELEQRLRELQAQKDALAEELAARRPAASHRSAPPATVSLSPQRIAVTSATGVSAAGRTVISGSAPATASPTSGSSSAGRPEAGAALRLPGLRLAAPRPASPPPEAGAGTTDVYRLVAEGESRLENGELEEAERLFRQALKQRPDLSEARLGLAACCYAAGDLAGAERAAAGVLAEDPQHPMALALSGLIEWRRARLSRAREFIQRALRADSRDARIHNYAGIIFHANGDDREALKHFEEAVRLDPGYAEAHFNRAVLLADGFGRLAEAREAYRRAVENGAAPDPWLENLLEKAAPSGPSPVPTTVSDR